MRILALIIPALLLTACGGENTSMPPNAVPAAQPAPPETREERESAIRDAFSEVQAPTTATPEDIEGIKALLDKLCELRREGEATVAVSNFDYGLMVRTASDQVVGNKPPESYLKDGAAGVRKGMLEGWSSDNVPLFFWHDNRIAKVELLYGGQRALAYCRHRVDDEGSFEKVRWWLRRDGDSWMIYDYEFLTSGIRLSRLLAAGMENSREQLRWARRIGELQTARLLLDQGDYERAANVLRDAESARFPADLEAVRRFLTAIQLLGSESYVAAARMAVDALAKNPDLTEARIIKARAHFNLNDHELALAEYRAYIEILGPDAMTLVEIADCLTWMDRFEEAGESYRRSLTDFPTLAGLIGLAACVDAEGAAELGPWFTKLPDPAAGYLPLVTQLYDYDGLSAHTRVINEAYRKLKPDDPMLAWYTAQVAAGDRDYATAAAALKPALNQAPEDRRQEFLHGYWKYMAWSGQAVAALQEAARSEESFMYLASCLWDGKPILELCEAWREGNEDKPALHHYLGFAAYETEKFAEAEPHFRQAMKLAATDHWLWVSSRYYLLVSLAALGKSLEAYTEFKGESVVFEVLAEAAFDRKDVETLDKLIAEHETHTEGDPLLRLYTAECAWLRKDWKAALAAYKSYITKLEDQGDLSYDVFERRVRAAIRAGELKDAFDAAKLGIDGYSYPQLRALAAAAVGDVAAVLAAAKEVREEWGEDLELYDDEDVGQILRGDVWTELHKLEPPPAKPD